MNRYIILITIVSILSTGCTTLYQQRLETKLQSLESRVDDLERFRECFNDDGEFDSNIGHDALDCDNL